jgi:LmbE family N-acetylglucosaminyl deacetylase
MSHQLYQRIYLSPHLDDAALSCGGLIYQQRQAGLSVLVVTVMAGDAPSDGRSSPIVDELHTRWGLGSNPNPAAARRAEDRQALSILKADLRHWEWPECVYRRYTDSGDFLYPSEASLWGAVHPTEKGFSARIARHLADLPLVSGGRVYAPLTVGGHVDHHLVRQAAELWGAPGGEMIYFEEYPYAEHPEALAAVLKDGDRWRAELIPLDEDALEAKTTAVACYDSQISTFFTDRDEIGARLRAYATLAGGGEWAERYWHRN